MSFQIEALDAAEFDRFFEMTEAELAEAGAIRVIADKPGAFPCRVSLKDADVGDELVLMNYEHLPECSPYRGRHAIYVRKGAARACLSPGEIPEVMAHRLLSVRGFSEAHLIVEGDVVPGGQLGPRLEAMFGNPDVRYVHIHNAAHGCFAGAARRI